MKILDDIPAVNSKPTQKTKTKFVHKSLHEELRVSTKLLILLTTHDSDAHDVN